MLSFLSQCAAEDWDLTDAQMSSITSVVFAGELISAFFWGPIADKFGRRLAFLVACTIIFTAGLLSAFSPSYEWLLFLRAGVGFGVGGLTVPFDLLAEFLPASKRGSYLMVNRLPPMVHTAPPDCFEGELNSSCCAHPFRLLNSSGLWAPASWRGWHGCSWTTMVGELWRSLPRCPLGFPWHLHTF